MSDARERETEFWLIERICGRCGRRRRDRADLLLIPCRSARLNWPTVESILRNRPVMPSVNEKTLEIAERDYRKLSMETAQRTVRFWQLHNRIEK